MLFMTGRSIDSSVAIDPLFVDSQLELIGAYDVKIKIKVNNTRILEARLLEKKMKKLAEKCDTKRDSNVGNERIPVHSPGVPRPRQLAPFFVYSMTRMGRWTLPSKTRGKKSGISEANGTWRNGIYDAVWGASRWDNSVETERCEPYRHTPAANAVAGHIAAFHRILKHVLLLARYTGNSNPDVTPFCPDRPVATSGAPWTRRIVKVQGWP